MLKSIIRWYYNAWLVIMTMGFFLMGLGIFLWIMGVFSISAYIFYMPGQSITTVWVDLTVLAVLVIPALTFPWHENILRWSKSSLSSIDNGKPIKIIEIFVPLITLVIMFGGGYIYAMNELGIWR